MLIFLPGEFDSQKPKFLVRAHVFRSEILVHDPLSSLYLCLSLIIVFVVYLYLSLIVFAFVFKCFVLYEILCIYKSASQSESIFCCCLGPTFLGNRTRPRTTAVLRQEKKTYIFY